MAKRKLSKEQLRAIHAKRPYQAVNRDNSMRAQHTYPDTAENRLLWVDNPRRVDIEGLDTPMVRNVPKKDIAKTPYKMGDTISLQSGASGKITRINDDSITYEQMIHSESGAILESSTVNLKDQKRIQRTDPQGHLINSWSLKEYHGEPQKRKSKEDVERRIKAIEESIEDEPHEPVSAPSTSTEFKADAGLLNKELLRQAHSGTSLDPEKRAESEKQFFEIEVEEVYTNLKQHAQTDKQKEELKDEMSRFQAKYAEKYNDTLAARGRLLSPMITGPANFPVRRNEKAYDSYENKVRANSVFREKVVSGITKRWRKENIVDAGGESVLLKLKLKNAEDHQQHMKASNRILLNKKLTEEGKVKKFMDDLGLSEKEARAMFKPDVMGTIGYAPYNLTNNNANIKRMKDRVTVMERNEQTETSSRSFTGGKITDNREADRVQIFFDGKPDDDMRKKLKGSGWRWAPSNGSWQRKRTNNAIYSAKHITGIAK